MKEFLCVVLGVMCCGCNVTFSGMYDYCKNAYRIGKEFKETEEYDNLKDAVDDLKDEIDKSKDVIVDIKADVEVKEDEKK